MLFKKRQCNNSEELKKAVELKPHPFARFLSFILYSLTGKTMSGLSWSRNVAQDVGVSEVSLARMHRNLKKCRTPD